MTSTPLPVPDLGALRIASPADIMRTGVVAAAGLCSSPMIDWQRPWHRFFPYDTLTSYRHLISAAIQSRDHIVLVATDRYDKDENYKTTVINDAWEAPPQGSEVVVGVAVWKLTMGSARIGTFQNDDGEHHPPAKQPPILPNKPAKLGPERWNRGLTRTISPVPPTGDKPELW